MSFKILVINPGSTSTKIGVYEDETLLFDRTLRHSAEDIAQFNSIPAQKDWRCQLVLKALREENFDINTLSAVSGRGGLLRPIRRVEGRALEHVIRRHRIARKVDQGVCAVYYLVYCHGALPNLYSIAARLVRGLSIRDRSHIDRSYDLSHACRDTLCGHGGSYAFYFWHNVYFPIAVMIA